MFVLHELFLVECVEVTLKSLCHNWVNQGLASQRTTIQLESLIGLLVCRLILKLLRLIMGHSKK